MFHDYLKSFKEDNFREAIINLFKILNQKIEERDKYLNENLLAFPYVNGGLFQEEDIIIPRFTKDIIDLIENKMSADFDWSKISPTIFGAIFESTLNPATRRAGGMHYTSIENIHKVIDPLFLNDLKKDFDNIKEIKQKNDRNDKLKQLQNKLSTLKFLDPAAGSGNFLTETYKCLRKIENEILRLLYVKGEGQNTYFGDDAGDKYIKVSISQFYGIEINDFAVTVANTALWIAEYQMLKETENIIGRQIGFLPLKNYNHIVEGNALTLDWKEVVEGVDYIMGNPPFVGARIMNESQKQDLNRVFDGYKNIGDLDYVSCWYKKSVDFIEGTDTKVALVSTNSLCQGASVALLWKPLFERGIEINFAHRTFRWDSESNEKAKVHCVIVGFSSVGAENSPVDYSRRDRKETQKIIYDDNRPQVVSHINAYLIDADDVFVESRNKPICDVPEIGIGNQLIDDGNYLFTKEEKEVFVKKEPKSEKYFHLIYGAEEYINNKIRYCLYLGECSPAELKSMPMCLERVDKVRKFRLGSVRPTTLKLADKPTHFGTEKIMKTNCLIIPSTSSENRRYIPIGFLTPEYYATHAAQIIPTATLYHFGILTSNVHMAWMRAVAGRLKSDYRYSKDIVYNNFPWLDVLYEGTKNNIDNKPAAELVEHKKKIEQTAKAILDARAKYPDSSLADMYDPNTMPIELKKAHTENDKAVMKAYGFKTSYTEFSEQDCVKELMMLYKKL